MVNLQSRGPGGGLTIDKYIMVYCFPDMKKCWESNPDKLNLGAGTKGHSIGTWQDSRLSFTPPGLSTTNVLCDGVYETHSVWLEHYFVEQHEPAAQ